MRFSLSALMLFIVFAAALCGIFIVLPGGWSVLLLTFLSSVLLAAAIAGCIFGEGKGRAFFVGYAVSACCLFVIIAAIVFGQGDSILFRSSVVRQDSYDRILELKVIIGGYFVASLLSGMAAIGVCDLFSHTKP